MKASKAPIRAIQGGWQFEWHGGKLLIHSSFAALGKLAWRLERRLGRSLSYLEERQLVANDRPDGLKTRQHMLSDGAYRLVARDGGLVYEARP